MTKNFKDADTQLLWETGRSHRIPANLRVTALKKLAILHWATNLIDVAVPPGNRLEALKGNRRGQHGIRINDQYRLCFVWRNGDAHDVEIVDYH
ncbi:MAG TPA: type II toxin-antitoxin system RelE/ParE family toxin [Terracidiphilus sp.]|jgi:proteic killer suppression protein|nr:type II toxin-antitoxin system RelE/ParE family toxin [Terracidiphilus sp.]